ncbi:unnamed protein product [Camellia sinensis]
MASTSGSRPHGGVGRISSTATTLFSDNQYLIAEIRKVMITMKEVAVDLERDTESQMVKELEDGLLQLLVASEDCANFSSALQSVGHVYQPGEELTDFKKLFDDEITKSKANSSSIPPNHPLLRQFREAIWQLVIWFSSSSLVSCCTCTNPFLDDLAKLDKFHMVIENRENVHHAGQPMPGEEQEDLVMTSTQFNLLNIKCPLTGKPITELEEPVRSYIRSKNIQCPVAGIWSNFLEELQISGELKKVIAKIWRYKYDLHSGCPRILQAARVACDPLLLVEIEEMRSSTKHSVRPDMVEDFTELDEEDSVRQIGAFTGMEYYFTPNELNYCNGSDKRVSFSAGFWSMGLASI